MQTAAFAPVAISIVGDVGRAFAPLVAMRSQEEVEDFKLTELIIKNNLYENKFERFYAD